jgi:transposase
MGNKKRDVSGLMSRRLHAAALFAKGLTHAEVARRLGVSRTSTMNWYDAWKAKGKQGLQLAEHFGRPTKTTAADLAQIEAALLKGPAAHGWTTEIWTLPRIATYIPQIATSISCKHRAFRSITGRPIPERREDATLGVVAP